MAAFELGEPDSVTQNSSIFIGAFLLASLSVWEKLANMAGLTVLRGYYTSGRLLEFSAVALLFVIALQLREMKLTK